MFISSGYWAPINARLVWSLTILTFVGDDDGGCKTDMYDCKICRFGAVMFISSGYWALIHAKLVLSLTILAFVGDGDGGC